MMKYDIAIVGATGIVGETLLAILAEREFPVGTLYALASERSAGELVSFGNQSLIVEDVATFDFSTVQFAFFSAGSDVSLTYAPIAAELGCTVIDNTSAFRYDKAIPLVVPEVNPQVLADFRGGGIIANPNCSTIQLVVALKPIHDTYGVKRVNVATYQSVSGAGSAGISGLAKETADLLNGQGIEETTLSQQIAFNVIPHIDQFESNGYTREEMKMVWETQKILGDPELKVNPTAVRVPVFFGHSEAVHLELMHHATAEDITNLLSETQGIEVMSSENYPTPVTDAASQDAVFVGRIREDISQENGINLWVVSDNVRKGAALNAIQIAELIAHNSLYRH